MGEFERFEMQASMYVFTGFVDTSHLESMVSRNGGQADTAKEFDSKLLYCHVKFLQLLQYTAYLGLLLSRPSGRL